MRPRSALFPFQVDAIARLCFQPQLAELVKMGMGKSVITHTALRDLGARRTLVVAPATVVEEDVWGKEARAWEHLAGVSVGPLDGGPVQRQAVLAADHDINTVSYENLIWLTDLIDVNDRYDAIVFDELSKLKTPGSKRFKRMRSNLGGVNIPVRFGLTGTPVGNHLLDLWGEMFLVCGEAPLGPRYIDYKLQYFHSFDRDQLIWEPNFGAPEEILARVKPYAFSLDEKLAAGKIPPVLVNPIHLELPASVRKMEHELATVVKTTLDSGTDLVAFSASALALKVRQLASGAVYTDPLDETKWETVHAVKLDRLEEMVDAMQGEPLLVFYWYRHELARLKERFPCARCVGDKGVVDSWNRREVPVMLAHPASAGHGLNLQHGGSSICWYTLPYSLELWMQGNGREARVGQKAPYVTAHALLAGEADAAVLDVLREKTAVERGILTGCVMETKESLLHDPFFG